MPTVTVTIGEADRELLLLALATLAVQQSGWHHALSTLASQFSRPEGAIDDGRVIFEQFVELQQRTTEGEHS